MIISRRTFLKTTALGVTLLPRRVLGVGWVAAGCVVVGVGAVVTIWVIPFCKKHFGTTEAKKDGEGEDQFVGNFLATSEEDEMAALDCIHYKNNCGGEESSSLLGLNTQEPSESQGVEIVATLTDRAGQPHIETQLYRKKPEVPMSFVEFQAHLMSRHGLLMNGGTGSQSSYGRNRQPATAEQVPITFTRDQSSSFSGVIIGDGPGHTLALERTENFVDWSTVTKLTTAINGKQISFMDMSNKPHAFYRVRLVS
jgi:hypothetical protein